MNHRDTETQRARREDGGARDPLSEQVLGCAIEVHRNLGPGLLESAYEACLCHEMESRRIPFRRQVPLPILYKDLRLDCAYRMDVVVRDELVLDLKTDEQVTAMHQAHLLTYLKLSGYKTGLLLNFHSAVLKDGVKRMVL